MQKVRSIVHRDKKPQNNVSKSSQNVPNNDNSKHEAPNVPNVSKPKCNKNDSQVARLTMVLGCRDSSVDSVFSQPNNKDCTIFTDNGFKELTKGDEVVLLDCAIDSKKYKVFKVDMETGEIVIICNNADKGTKTIKAGFCAESNKYAVVFDQQADVYFPVHPGLTVQMRTYESVTQNKYSSQFNLSNDTIKEWTNANIYTEKGIVKQTRISKESSGDKRDYWEILVEFATGKGIFWIPSKFIKHFGDACYRSSNDQWCQAPRMGGNDGAFETGCMIYQNVFRETIVEVNDVHSFGYIVNGNIEWPKVNLHDVDDDDNVVSEYTSSMYIFIVCYCFNV